MLVRWMELGFPYLAVGSRKRWKLNQFPSLTRRSKILGIAAASVAFLLIYANSWRLHAEIPPTYRAWHEEELVLPQNDPALPYPQGRTGKYVRVANHVSKLGWGNVMQEMILNAHMALKSGRTFVFYNYTWDSDARRDYVRYSNNYTPSRIPISAFAKGPIAGRPFPPQHRAPPAVSWEFFDEVCEQPARIDIDPQAAEVSSMSAASLVDYYVSMVQGVESRCVEFVSHVGKEVFDYTLFGDGSRLLDIWDELVSSPILTEWMWSDLVVSVVEDNYALIHPMAQRGWSQREPLPGSLALHIRHGDYARHCQYLLKHRAPFHGYNQYERYPDRFFPPPGGQYDEDVVAFYDLHCVPEIPYMVKRVMEVRRDHARWTGRTLDRIYILTNANREWLYELKAALRTRAGWHSIVSSRDLTLTAEQKFVAQAADMMIATRAEVFLGNGWSSLTANSNLLRAAAHRRPNTTRFW
ncbi:hypothetical protein K488DRAFT_85300 [Vararia minispora EC-137]|uniref:Uncharacterized protein n=1 Tax=Vararia minispora EC-137 TaxID=1314806 RepID=A0ACB8QMW1_9AGAM|nr:hypothetical protein K488DRAFT_85300 [Vararia minispora EC-137]